MGKKGGNNSEKKAKKAPDVTAQKIKKARNCLKSGGKRGLDAFLSQNPDIRSNAEVKKLIQKAGTLPQRAPKGQRGPKSPQEKDNRRAQERARENIEVEVARREGKTAEHYQVPESERRKGQSSFGSMTNLRKAMKLDPEGTKRIVKAEGAGV